MVTPEAHFWYALWHRWLVLSRHLSRSLHLLTTECATWSFLVIVLLPGTFLVFITSNEVVWSNLTGRLADRVVSSSNHVHVNQRAFHFNRKKCTWKLPIDYKNKLNHDTSVPGSKHQCCSYINKPKKEKQRLENMTVWKWGTVFQRALHF